MKKQVIFTDANELILLLKSTNGPGRTSHMINKSDIRRISFSTYIRKKFFGIVRKPDRRITIICRLGNVEFDECRHPVYFDSYLDMLRSFCKENKITFYDFPEEK